MQWTMMIAQAGDGWSAGGWVLLAVGVLVGIVVLALVGPAFGLWIQALSAQAHVGILDLIGMRLRKVNPQIIVLSKIQAVRAGLTPTTDDLDVTEDLTKYGIYWRNCNVDDDTDDTMPFQAAVHYMTEYTDGGSLYVPTADPKAIHLCNCLVSDNLTIYGNGIDVSIIRGHGGSTVFEVVGDNVTYKNLSIYGTQYDCQTGGGWKGGQYPVWTQLENLSNLRVVCVTPPGSRDPTGFPVRVDFKTDGHFGFEENVGVINRG